MGLGAGYLFNPPGEDNLAPDELEYGGGKSTDRDGRPADIILGGSGGGASGVNFGIGGGGANLFSADSGGDCEGGGGVGGATGSGGGGGPGSGGGTGATGGGGTGLEGGGPDGRLPEGGTIGGSSVGDTTGSGEPSSSSS